jgi:hypothetical protein
MKYMLKKIILTFLIVFFFVGSVHAQESTLPEPGMLPTNPFYFLKTWSESIGTFFTFRQEAKVERMLYLSEKRLAEAEELSNLGETELAEKILARYEKHLSAAMERAQNAKAKGQDVEDVLGQVAEATYKHQDVLTGVLEKAPEQAKESIQRAMQESMRGREKALESISEQSRERVMENVQERVENNNPQVPGVRGPQEDPPVTPENFMPENRGGGADAAPGGPRN